MSAKAVTYWQVACDCCGVVCDDYGEFSAWSDPDAAVESRPDDWMEVDGGDYCDECWTWPEDMPGYAEDESTSGEPVRKHKHHHTREVGGGEAVTLMARFSGTCPECGERWQSGDLIRSDDYEPGALPAWRHAVCPDDAVDVLAAAHPICQTCWLDHPEGACDR